MMRYKALGPKEDVDPEKCLLQAAQALDAAAEVAEVTNDVEGLLNVSAMWIKFSESVSSFAEFASSHPGEDHESKSKIETGFQRPDITVDKEKHD